MAIEKGYRPARLADLEGQPKVQKMLGIYIQAAKLKGECLDHVLISAPSGIGKTTTAKIIANELDKPYKAYSGPSICDIADISEILLNINEGDILFIDEIHALKKKLQEMLYFAMEQYEADVVFDGTVQHISIPHFTLIGATNISGTLNDAMVNRFPIQIKLTPYSDESMVKIVENICASTDIAIDAISAEIIAGTTRGVPRNANSHVRRIHDYATVVNNGKITPDVVMEALEFMEINRYGLNRDDMAYLKCLVGQKKPVGVNTIALIMGTDKVTVETKIEPYLLRKGYIQKAPKGRILSSLGKEVMK